MINLTDYLTKKQKIACYGCRACEQICPKNAITVIPDDEGFLYPVLDEEKCVKCGLCKKSCPYHSEKCQNESKSVYAVQNKQKEELLKSSSGGVFSALAREVIFSGGAVAGCVFTEDIKAEHIITSDYSVVEKMQGSKYVQSDVKDVFPQIKNMLDDDKAVLFTGTPCQVAGLKLFLNKPYENLLTVDLVCHGVPSPELLKMFVDSFQESKGKLSELKFRDKARNGWRSEGTLFFEKGKSVSFSPYRDSYYNLYYMRNCVSRLSCYECKYASPLRVGDITIGDFWNASDFLDEKDYEGGISVVLVNTNVGEKFFNSIKDRLNVFESDLETAQKGNARLVGGQPIPENRKDFYKKVKEEGYKKAAENECKYSHVVPFIKKHIPKGLKKTMKKFLG